MTSTNDQIVSKKRLAAHGEVYAWPRWVQLASVLKKTGNDA